MKKTPLILSFIILSFATSAQITSTFDANADGWTYLSSATPITVNHQSSGGNPGGYASVTYSSNAGTSTQNWIAPSKFLGSHLALSMGMNLKFDLQQSQAGTIGSYDARIENGGNFIYFVLPVKPAVAPAWSSYSIALDENSGWKYNGGGTNATREQIRSILINITALHIRGAYATNASYTSGLDNVVLEQRTLPVAPSITSLSATSGEPGTTLTINGGDFNPTPANNAVYFGAIAGTVTSASATQLTVTIPVGAQYGPIKVLNKTNGVSRLSSQIFNPTFSGGGRIIPASFDPKSDITLSIDIEGLSMADIDGDGWLDLAVASSTGFKAIEIYRNLGLGGDLTASSFAPKITVTIPGTSTNTTGLQFADLDGDGRLDAVTSNVLVTFGGSYFITYRNISTPGNIAFESYETWYGLTDDSAPSLVADIDGDGRPELIGGEGSYSTGAFFWIAQNISTPGDIEYGASVGYFTLGSNGGFGAATMGDLDNDGKPEMLVTYGDRFSIFKNNSTPGTISLTDIGMVSHFQYVSNLQVADFNLDGKNDLIWKRTGNGEFYIRINTNSGGALATTDFTTEIILSGDVSTYGGMSIADINGDGKPDIVACDNGNLGVFENNFSGGVFDATAFVPAYAHQGNGGGSYPTSPLMGDLNGDNKPEIIFGTTNASPPRISIFENKNIHAPVISLNTVSPLKGIAGSTVTITGNNFSTIPSENKVWFGRVEATVLTSTANLITVAVPAGASNAPVSVTKNGLTSRYRVPFQTTFGSGVTFDNTHFAPPVSYTLTGAIYDIETGDLNRDGKLDIIALGTASNTYAFRNVYTTGAINSSSLLADDTLAGSLNPRLEDFDGDGYFDVMAVNGPLRKNNSTLTEISFLPQVIVPLGASIVDFGDFNNDGKSDMTLTTDLSGAGDLIVLENRTGNITGSFVAGGFGSFSGNFIYNKPAPSGATITGDFDSDGFDDIVTTNPIADNISIYRNLGVLKISQAQFARVDMPVGDNPGRIYKGDFDSDGKPDLLLYHGTGTSTTLLIILQNTSTVGNISFSRIDLTNPNVVTVAHIADLDGDGRPEILTTAEANNRFSIFKNIHTGGALTAASFGAPFNTTVTAPRGITTGNLNSDSKPEIIITRAAGLLVVYENLIPASPPPTITSFTPTSGPVGTTVILTGTNFDATPDNNIVYFGATRAVVTAATPTQLTVTVPIGATYQNISVLVNGLIAYSSKPFITTYTGGGTVDACSFAPKQDLTAGMFPLSIVSGDFDGDGKADMAVANYDNNILSLFRNTSSIGSISYAPKIDITSGPNTDHISTDDLDGDGKLDLVVTDGGGASVYRNTSTGVGTISFAARISFAVGGSDPRHAAIDDFDKDGKPDLVVANYDAGVNTISVLRNTSSGPGNISYAPKVDFASSIRPSSVSAGDLDGDGMPDIAVVNQNSNTLSVFRNTSTGTGNISFAAKVDFTTGSNPLFVSIGDLDDDNKPELAVGHSIGTSSSVVSVFRNLSSGIGNINYAPKTDFTIGSVPFSVSIGDVDGDSKPDLVSTNVSSFNLSILRNTSTGAGNISFAGKVDFTTNSNSQSVSITDFDGDGKPDLAATSFFGVHVLRNTIFLPPGITSFTPTNGLAGTTVIITGTNFSPTPANNIVSFNGTPAAVTASTATSITTTVPDGATSGTITVTVECNTGTSATNFTVAAVVANQPPQITTTSASVPIQGIITIDLEELISDPDDDLDLTTLQIITQPVSGAAASLNNFILTIDYAGIAFSGTDQIEIGICDLTGICTQQELTIELAGEIEVFNALSPNGDGQNEFLFLRFIELLPDTQSNHVSIYNRWGDVVWEGSNYNNQTVVFDGTNKNGKELPSGTYFYKIEFSSSLESKTGFLSLKR